MERIKEILLYVMFFFYIYSVPFKGVPFGMGTRVLFAVFALLLLVLQFSSKKKRKVLQKSLLPIFAAIALFLSWAFLALIINGSTDLSLVKYSNSFIIMTLAGYFVVFSLFKHYGKLTFSLIAHFIIVAVTVQMVISLMMFVSPPFRQLLLGLQQLDAATDERMDAVLGLRITGFGSNFFTSGIVNGYCLILVACLIRMCTPTYKQLFKYVICFLTVLLVGTMMARTTLVGAGLAAALLLFTRNSARSEGGHTNLRLIVVLVFILISALGLYHIQSASTKDMISQSASFGFELFLNYLEGGELGSESTDELKTMFAWPETWHTYLFGDGRFVDVKNPELYYMYTDVGYLRLLYYFGVFGVLTFICIQYSLIRVGYYIHGNGKQILFIFFHCVFIYALLLNIKGFTDLFFLNILFCYRLMGARTISEKPSFSI